MRLAELPGGGVLEQGWFSSEQQGTPKAEKSPLKF
jgi:hypothetical protein